MAAPKKQRSLAIRRMRRNLLKIDLNIKNIKFSEQDGEKTYSISHYIGKKK